MTDDPTTVSALISAWPTIGEFAADIGCGYEAARQMRRRERIAPSHWPQVIAAAKMRGVDVITVEWLAERWIRGAVAAQRPVRDCADQPHNGAGVVVGWSHDGQDDGRLVSHPVIAPVAGSPRPPKSQPDNEAAQ